MEPKVLLLWSQEPVTGPYLEPHESIPHSHTLFFKISFKIIIPSVSSRLVLGWVAALEHHVPLAFHLGCEADHSPPSSAEAKEWVELYLHSSSATSWRGAQLGGAQGLYLYLVSEEVSSL
jgi:hypothetical protein